MEMVLTEADAGRVVEVAPGGQLALRLSENRSTGYTWVVEIAPPGCLVQETDHYQRRTSLAGTAGIRSMVFTLLPRQVRCTLDLVPRRPWEPTDEATRRLTYTVTAGR
jgi:predicted secreted protein